LHGNLSWDRYYGNELFIRFKDIKEQQTVDLTLLVRVIHTMDENKIPSFKDIEDRGYMLDRKLQLRSVFKFLATEII
jgi:hypothetical protein